MNFRDAILNFVRTSTFSLSAIARKYHLKLIVLFGSLAVNAVDRLRQESDADLAVLPKKSLSLHRELLLRQDLFSFFHREIDLIFLPRVTPLLFGQIVRHGKLLYGNRHDFSLMRVYGIKRFLDFEPYFRLREKIIRRSVRKFS